MLTDINCNHFSDEYIDYLYTHIPEVISNSKKFNCEINNNIYKLDRMNNTVTFKKVINNNGEVYTVNLDSLYDIYKTCQLLKSGKF